MDEIDIFRWALAGFYWLRVRNLVRECQKGRANVESLTEVPVNVVWSELRTSSQVKSNKFLQFLD